MALVLSRRRVGRVVLTQGVPAGRFGETPVADTFMVAADVIDPARHSQCRKQRAARVINMEGGAEPRVRVIVAGARAVEQAEAQHETPPPRLSESAACCSATSAERRMTGTSPMGVSSDTGPSSG